MSNNSIRTVEPLPPKPEGVPALTFGAFIYPQMDLLDIMGVLRVFGESHPRFNTRLILIGETMDPVVTDQQVKISPEMTVAEAPYLDYFFMPGGHGTADVIANKDLMKLIHKRIEDARWCLTVCTGAAILAATGLADGRYMTTNKAVWNQFIDFGPKIKWVKRARWVQDGKFVTSSGVSAGMDMAFYVISQLYGEDLAKELANWIEYTRHTDAEDDPFSDVYPENRDTPSGVVPTRNSSI
ncbi:hypothetical protein DFQ27_003412 [Actinomortierella ambigua]|uniref:DJ-1/PfpI domain-containing protein n=1 Tax=Actinomortierella ambigua TaxID=1343610 RepID=A0A9P6U5Q3_9FUNG|nr:hypothetical protein DFQ27_003412 [Actinomortierella ambigua]